jgi:hypothetical protein
MLDATSVFATVVLALFMREELRVYRQQLPRRSIWLHFNVLLWTSCTFLLLADCIIGICVMVGFDEYSGAREFLFALLLFLSLINISSGTYFFLISHELSKPLIAYIRMRHHYGDAPIPKHIGRLAFTLSMNGFFLIFGFSMHICLVTNMAFSTPHPELFTLNFFGFALSRVGIAYWHVSLFLSNARSIILRVREPFLRLSLGSSCELKAS